MAKLSDVLAALPSAEQLLFKKRLGSLVGHRATTFQAHHNLEAESRLPEAAWQELIEHVLNDGEGFERTRNAIRSVCRRWILSGTEVTVAIGSPTFGRAVTVDSMVSLLRKSHPGRGRDFAWREVRDLWVKPLGLIKARWSNRELGLHLMWSTFSPNGKHPFQDLPKTADGIRRILGLDPRLARKPILLLEYKLSDGMPRFPTVADAYAGDEWSYFFRPAPDGSPHGWTMPWPDYASKSKPRPEVVHPVIKGESLVNSPRFLS
jgi:hypothetical protein